MGYSETQKKEIEMTEEEIQEQDRKVKKTIITVGTTVTIVMVLKIVRSVRELKEQKKRHQASQQLRDTVAQHVERFEETIFDEAFRHIINNNDF